MKGHITMHALTLEEYFVKHVLSEIEIDEEEVSEDISNIEEDSYNIDETTQASEEVNEVDYLDVRLNYKDVYIFSKINMPNLTLLGFGRC